MSEMRTLRPGLLVSMNTSIKGNVHYRAETIEDTHVTDEGEQRARWETTKIVTDPAEHAAAVKLRTKVRGLLLAVCSVSAFGLLCPEDKQEQLTAAIAEARNLVDTFNMGAGLTRMGFSVIYGRIAQDDVEAVRAISAEIRSLMDDMQEGLANLDVKAVRDAANKAKSIGTMLSPEANARLEVAINAARSSARKIVKAGEVIGKEIDRAAIAQIDMARTSFLDFDVSTLDVAEPAMSGRALDL